MAFFGSSFLAFGSRPTTRRSAFTNTATFFSKSGMPVSTFIGEFTPIMTYSLARIVTWVVTFIV